MNGGTGASATYGSGKSRLTLEFCVCCPRVARRLLSVGCSRRSVASHVSSKVRERSSAHPEAVLCCTEINLIDEHGAPSVHYPNYKNIETLGFRPVDRIHALLSLPGWFAIYGLMRREILQKISLGLNVFAWDVILLLEILLIGPNAKVPETLFTFRVAEPRNAQEYAQIFQNQAASSAMPYAGAAVHLLETVYRSTLSSSEKSQAFAHFIVDCQSPPWRVTIAEELLGPNIRVDDSSSRCLRGCFDRCVPFHEIEHNALCKAILRSAMDPPDLLRIARRSSRNPIRL